MTAKLLMFHGEAREKVCAGLNILASAVKVTLGPKGRAGHARAQLRGADRDQLRRGRRQGNRARGPVREPRCADGARGRRARTSETAGDGTTTATVLAQAIVNEGMKYVAAGLDPMDLKRGIDAAVDAVVAELKKNSPPLQLGTGDRPGRDHIRQRRRFDRRNDRQGDGQGRRQRRHQDRGRPRDDQRARRGRRHAVRPRFPVAVLHHRRGKAAHRARRRVRAGPRPARSPPSATCCRCWSRSPGTRDRCC